MFKNYIYYILWGTFIYSSQEPTVCKKKNILDLVTIIKPIQAIITDYLNDWIIDKIIAVQEPTAEFRAISHDGKHLITSVTTINPDESAVAELSITDTDSNKIVKKITILNLWPSGEIHFLPDNQQFYVFNNGYINTYSINNNKVKSIFTQIINPHQSSISNNGDFIAAAYTNMHTNLLNIKTREKHTFTGHTGSISSITFSPDNKYIASVGADDCIKVWNTATKEKKFTLKHRRAYHYRINFLASYNILSTSSRHTIKFWDLDHQIDIFKKLNLPKAIQLMIHEYLNHCISSIKVYQAKMGDQRVSSENYICYLTNTEWSSPEQIIFLNRQLLQHSICNLKAILDSIYVDSDFVRRRFLVHHGSVDRVTIKPLQKDKFFITARAIQTGEKMLLEKDFFLIIKNQALPNEFVYDTDQTPTKSIKQCIIS